jgi:hypothetical protein
MCVLKQPQSADLQVYIPVSPLLLEMLHWAELKKRPSGSTGAAPDMLLLLRLSKVQLRSASVQEEVVQQVREEGVCSCLGRW